MKRGIEVIQDLLDKLGCLESMGIKETLDNREYLDSKGRKVTLE